MTNQADLTLSPNSLVLVLPGVLEPQPALNIASAASLVKMLTRSQQETSFITVAEQALLSLNGFGVVAATELPAAACMQVGDFHESVPDTVCADPVWLKPDTDHARLYSADSLELDDADSEAMIDSLNHHFDPDGLTFAKGPGNRWYLSGRSGVTLATLPVSSIAGRNVQTFLPTDRASREWRQLMTEVQMLLHNHPANEQRAAKGLAPINSLWFWGGHALGQHQPRANVRVYADDAFSRGLARLTSQHVYPLAESAAASGSKGVQVVCQRGFEAAIVTGQVALAEAALLMSDKLVHAGLSHLKRGKLDELIVLSGDGKLFRLKRARLFQFWKRSQDLASIIPAAQHAAIA